MNYWCAQSQMMGSDMEHCRHSFSGHALKRAQQRGIRPVVVDFVLQHADIDLEAGNGCRSYRISHRAGAELCRNGVAVTVVDRAIDVVVIICEYSGEVVTVMHDC